MIPARRSVAFNAWFAGHARKRIRATFGAMFVRGLSETRRAAVRAPLLIVANHTAWWDPLLALHVTTHLLALEGYALMDEKNLARLPFFALVGAFGVDREDPADGLRALRYAARLLDRPGRAVWVFPQGEERPITESPLLFAGGAAQVARIARASVVVPVALRYEFAGEEQPHLYLSFGEAIVASRDVEKSSALQAAGVQRELDRIERAVRGDRDGFEAVHRAAPSRFGAAATAMLALFTRHGSPPALPARAGRSRRG